MMETAAYTNRGNLKLVQASTLPQIATARRNRSLGDRVLQLTQALQTTLDIEKQILFLATETDKVIDVGSISYHNEQDSIDINYGDETTHAARYDLRLQEEYLGEIKISRSKRFANDELEAFENLLSALHYPVRNALHYHRALEAAAKDPLTGTYNRSTLQHTLSRELDLAARHDTPVSLLMFDIDHFKNINDTFGHQLGDDVICRVAEVTANTIRRSDMLFRFGGEEFVVISRHNSQEGPQLLAERIRKNVEKIETVNDTKMTITISLGVATSQIGESDKSLIKRADYAMYKAKNDGRNRTIIAD